MSGPGNGSRIEISARLKDLFARSRALQNQQGEVAVSLRLEKGDVAILIDIDAPEGSLLAALASWLPLSTLKAFTLQNLHAEVANNIIYVRRLEYGHSGQRPSGWIRSDFELFARMLEQEIKAAFDAYPDSPRAGLQAGLEMALQRISARLASRTPVLTGRAKVGWVIKFPDGRVVPVGDAPGGGGFTGQSGGVLRTLAQGVEDAATAAAAE